MCQTVCQPNRTSQTCTNVKTRKPLQNRTRRTHTIKGVPRVGVSSPAPGTIGNQAPQRVCVNTTRLRVPCVCHNYLHHNFTTGRTTPPIQFFVGHTYTPQLVSAQSLGVLGSEPNRTEPNQPPKIPSPHARSGFVGCLKKWVSNPSR